MERKLIKRCTEAFYETEPINSLTKLKILQVCRLFRVWSKVRPFALILKLCAAMVTLHKRRQELLTCIENLERKNAA
jgi:hypothetical protein